MSKSQIVEISGVESYIRSSGMSSFKALIFRLKTDVAMLWARFKLYLSIKIGHVTVGPFYGEFGNFLGHVLPFIAFLHKHNVKIVFCGLEQFRPFLNDSKGNSLCSEFIPIRDILFEAKPSMNSVTLPLDVQVLVDQFYARARNSFLFFDLGNSFYYFFIHKSFVARFACHVNHLDSLYTNIQSETCALFTRSKGNEVTRNNGERWDYESVVLILKRYFKTIYVVGHPSQVSPVSPQDGVELIITANNSLILEACAKSSHIFSQHSGTIYLAPLLRRRFVLMYKGGSGIEDIGSIKNTLYYLEAMNGRDLVDYCFGETQLEEYVSYLHHETT